MSRIRVMGPLLGFEKKIFFAFPSRVTTADSGLMGRTLSLEEEEEGKRRDERTDLT